MSGARAASAAPDAGRPDFRSRAVDRVAPVEARSGGCGPGAAAAALSAAVTPAPSAPVQA